MTLIRHRLSAHQPPRNLSRLQDQDHFYLKRSDNDSDWEESLFFDDTNPRWYFIMLTRSVTPLLILCLSITVAGCNTDGAPVLLANTGDVNASTSEGRTTEPAAEPAAAADVTTTYTTPASPATSSGSDDEASATNANNSQPDEGSSEPGGDATPPAQPDNDSQTHDTAPTDDDTAPTDDDTEAATPSLPEGPCAIGHISVMGECLPENLSVRTIDVGHGDAILIQLGDFDILIDAGKPTSHARERLDVALAAISGALDMLIVTHPHNDHVGSAAHVIETVEVTEIITNGEARDINAYLELEDVMSQRGMVPSHYDPQDTIEPFPGMSIQFLATGGGFPDSERGDDINNDSVVMLIAWAGQRVMLTGDIEEEMGDRLVAEHCPAQPWSHCPALEASILKVPHHGSSHQSFEFLRAVQPQFATISAGYQDRRYHLPRLSVVEYLRDGLNANVASTSNAGDHDITVTIQSNGTIAGPDNSQVYGWTQDSHGEWIDLVVSGTASPSS